MPMKLGIKGDYYLLSKGLGGGLAKISALLIAQRRYKPEFSLLHTSTFAEDDYSSTVAGKTLDILESDDSALLTLCEEKGPAFDRGVAKIQDRYPEVIREVRGEGLMIGLEFQDQYHSSSNILRQLSHQSDLVYCIAGHLLREHRIRVAPTLSQSFTLRVEPSLLIPDEEMDRFLEPLKSCRNPPLQGHLSSLQVHRGDGDPLASDPRFWTVGTAGWKTHLRRRQGEWPSLATSSKQDTLRL